MLRYAITDLHAQGLDNWVAHEARLREQIRGWSIDGIDIVQLREKQLQSGELLTLTLAAMDELQRLASTLNRVPRVLVNGRPDIAMAARADGVHLTSRPGELTPTQVKQLFEEAGLRPCTVSVSCHTAEEVRAAREAGADLLLFGPVFEKRVGGAVVSSGVGPSRLRDAVIAAGPVPVLALGGLTYKNAAACLNAGAAGLAAIRLFSAV